MHFSDEYLRGPFHWWFHDYSFEPQSDNRFGQPFGVDTFERVDDGINAIPFARSFKIGN